MKKKVILLKMLEETSIVLSRLKIEYWLDCGTLLGAIRDNELISWDNDIDLGCWKTRNDYELKQLLKIEFEELGYEVFLTDHYMNIHLIDYSEFNLDLNFYTLTNGMAVTPSSSLYPFLNDVKSKLANHMIKSIYNRKYYIKEYPRTLKNLFNLFLWVNNNCFLLLPSKIKNKYLDILISIRSRISKHEAEVVPVEYFKHIVKASVLDGTYSIPKESILYLRYRYGKTWKKPNDKWDTFTDDRTVSSEYS